MSIPKFMFKKILIIFLFLLICLFKPFLVLASDASNNKFGIHLADVSDEDLKKAASLVNSSGGDWGYVTLVIQENDRNSEKWQSVFNLLRRLHLIPIVRLATKPKGDTWQRPKKEDAESWSDFLNSLNWVIKKRYVILFNEPNHAKEWGGKVDPQNYGETAFEFAKKLKKKNADFFVMLAGLDAAAPSNPPLYEDEEVFLKKILAVFQCKDKTMSCPYKIFEFIDGWASHSYPNHGFVGSPYDSGRNSIGNYQWELTLIKKLGIQKDLPVFITETGWPHQGSQKLKVKSPKSKFYSEETAADYIKIAYQNVWLPDNKVVAVTPFILNYQGKPFNNFSWILPESAGFYPQYYAIQKIGKVLGEQTQINKINILTKLPNELLENSTYDFRLEIKNLGQAVLDKNDGYKLSIIDYKTLDKNSAKKLNQPIYFFSDLLDIEPFDSQKISFHFKTDDKKGKRQINIGLFKREEMILPIYSWDFEVAALPSLEFYASLFPKINTASKNFEIQIFDMGGQLIYKKEKASAAKGKGIINNVHNIVLNEQYRVVILHPYYLPRQNFIVFHKKNNIIEFKRMLPLDFNKDGKFSFFDILALIKNILLLILWQAGR